MVVGQPQRVRAEEQPGEKGRVPCWSHAGGTCVSETPRFLVKMFTLAFKFEQEADDHLPASETRPRGWRPDRHGPGRWTWARGPGVGDAAEACRQQPAGLARRGTPASFRAVLPVEEMA